MSGVSRFFIVAFNFPTLLFTILLMVSVLYWLITLLGFMDGDMTDLVDIDAEGAFDLSGLLATLGLHGVPLPMTVTLLSLFSWLSSYVLQLSAISYQWSSGGWMMISLGILVISVVAGYLLAVMLARWLRPVFATLYQHHQEHCMEGLSAVVTGLARDSCRGRARVSREGVDLTVNVRAVAPLKHGMRVLLVREERGLYYWVEDVTPG